MYTILHNGKQIKPKTGSRWLWSKEKFDVAYANNEIVINENENGFSVRFKQYLKDKNGKIRNGKPLSIKADVFNQEGTKEVADLLGKRGVFDFPKPVNLLSYFFSCIINEKAEKEGIYLDFFSGSASSAHAIMQLNAAEDGGGRRKFIMVQIPEPCDEKSEAYKAGYKNISEIGKERIRRAGDKIVSETGKTDLDIGFKVFKLDTSNLKEWDSEAEDLENQIDWFGNPIKEGRTTLDVVYEVMLKYGVDLSTPVQEETIDGKTIYDIGAGALYVCLDNDITVEQAREIANRKPLRVVFKDAGFKDDNAKLNVVQLLKHCGIEEIRSI